MLAALHGHTSVVKVSLAAGADTRHRNNKRERARDLAEFANHPQITRLLEEHENSKSWLKKLRNYLKALQH